MSILMILKKMAKDIFEKGLNVREVKNLRKIKHSF
jgi:hypothetical protein